MLASKILVIGGDGTVGTALKRVCRERGIRAFFSTRDRSCKEPTSIFLDLNDVNMNLESFDVIVYLAQSARYRDYPHGLSDLSQINVIAPALLVRMAAKAQAKFVYFSTGSVYAQSNGPICESGVLKHQGNLDSYSFSKLLGEVIVLETNSFNLIIRPFFVYGKGAKEGALFPSLVRSVLQRQEIKLAGESGLVFNPISANEAALALIHLIELDAYGIYNVAGPDTTDLKYIVERISSYVEASPIFRIDAGTTRIVADCGKLLSTGYTFSETLDAGLEAYLSEIKLP